MLLTILPEAKQAAPACERSARAAGARMRTRPVCAGGVSAPGRYGWARVTADCALDTVTCIIRIKFKVKGLQTWFPAKIIWETEKKSDFQDPYLGNFN